MYYVNCYTFFEEPEKDWVKVLVSFHVMQIHSYTLFVMSD